MGNPADPSHLDFQTNVNAAQFRPRPAPRQQFQQAPVQRQQETIPNPSSVPACANCAGVNPFLNPADSSHAELFSSQPAAPAFSQPASTFVPQQPQQPNPAFQFQQRTQSQQQPLQPAFQQPSQQTFRQPSQQTFRQPAQPAQSSLNDFQGQLSLNR